MKIVKGNNNIPRMLIVVFFILVASFIIVGHYYYLSKDNEIKTTAQNNLAAIADLKIGQITNWRNERKSDALIIQNITGIARLVKNYIETNSHEEELKRWVAAFCEHKGYSSATILDTRGAVRFAYGEGGNKMGPVGYGLLEDVLKQKKFALSDLHISSVTKKVTFDLLVPLIFWEQKDHPVVGIFFFKVDPDKVLYPLIQSWPTSSLTSETLLIRREGDEVVYLNELRHKKVQALSLRLPIARKDLPAAMAARGAEGTVEGVDYRGAPVLAAIRKVPNSPWFMIAKVDKAEVYDPLHHELIRVAFVTVLLIIASGAILGLWWRHQRSIFYRARYQSEIERRALIEHFSYLAKYANDMIFLFDKQGKLIEVNERACEEYEYRREELLKMNILELRPPELRSGVADILGQLDEAEEGMIYETEHVRKDGTRFPVEVSARGFDIEGNRYMQAIIRDITERKQSQNALFAEKERLAVTLRSISDGVITTDVNGNITMLNKMAEELTGWSVEQAMGRPLAEVFHIINEQTRERCENPVDKVLKSGVIVGLGNHTALIRRDGGEMAIADSGAPIRDRESKVIGVVLVFRDITDKQKTDSALQNAEKLEAIGLLAGGIAHDFNNLLGGIFGYIDLARMQAEKGNSKGIENALSKACGVYDRAKSLTQQLLVFSKGGAPVRKTQSLAEHMQQAVSFALSGSNVSPVFTIPDAAWPCDFDENQMAQVFDNIAINARQAMPLGGKLDVAVRNIAPEDAPRELPPCAHVCVSICDYGNGIPKDHMSRIFDPFFTTKQQGSGLGLATSYSIVKKHDGLIHAESELGKGTTFHVYLPTSPGQVSVLEGGRRRQLHRGHGRILIMDDEEFILDVLSEMLTEMGYQAITAINGDEAIAHAGSAVQSGEPFRAAILDLTIPGGRGGKETVHALLEIDPDIKVVASTGYSEDPVMAKPSDYGFAGRLIKPYHMDQLALLLDSLLKQP